MIQDATLIHSDPDHTSSDTPRGGGSRSYNGTYSVNADKFRTNFNGLDQSRRFPIP